MKKFFLFFILTPMLQATNPYENSKKRKLEDSEEKENVISKKYKCDIQSTDVFDINEFLALDENSTKERFNNFDKSLLEKITLLKEKPIIKYFQLRYDNIRGSAKVFINDKVLFFLIIKNKTLRLIKNLSSYDELFYRLDRREFEDQIYLEDDSLESIWDIHFSNNGNSLAIAAEDSLIIANLKEKLNESIVKQFSFPKIRKASISNDGKYILIACYDDSLKYIKVNYENSSATFKNEQLFVDALTKNLKMNL